MKQFGVGFVLVLFLTGAALSGLCAEPAVLTVKADQGKKAYPIWVDKGEELQFKVEGQWTMWDQWELVDFRGHERFKKVDGFALGALLCKIEGGEVFAVSNDLRYRSSQAGLVVLYANRGSYAHLKASGSMRVQLSGGRLVDEAEAERMAGWDVAVLDTGASTTYMSAGEKQVLLLLNKARFDPPRFARQYLSDKIDKGDYARECYDEMLALKSMAVFKPALALSRSSADHAKDMGRTGQTGHVSSDGSTMDTRIKRYGDWRGMIAENCSYGFDDPLSIVLQLLIDDGVPSRGHRRNIFNPKALFVGVSIQPHKRYGFNCVQDFAGGITDLTDK